MESTAPPIMFNGFPSQSGALATSSIDYVQSGQPGEYVHTVQQPIAFRPAYDVAPECARIPPGVAASRHRFMLSQNFVTVTGFAVLLLLVALPISDAFILLNDFNYVFWSGNRLPIAVIAALVFALLLFLASSGRIGGKGVENYSHGDLATLAATFLSLIALILALASLALFHREVSNGIAMQYSCSASPVGREVSLAYSKLLHLRQNATCATKFSIAECPGFVQAAAPVFANYLQSLERTFHCSGFCHKASPPKASLPQISSEIVHLEGDDHSFCQTSILLARRSELKTMDSDSSKELNEGMSFNRKKSSPPVSTLGNANATQKSQTTAVPPTKTAAAGTKTASNLSQPAQKVQPVKQIHSVSSPTSQRQLPKALFSPYTPKATCDGAAARSLSALASSTSQVWWWEAIALFGASAALTLLEWTLCFSKKPAF